MSPRTFVARSAAILSLAALGLAACESKTIVQPQVIPVSIVVSPTAVTLNAVGQKAQFVAVVTAPADQPQTYSWNSSNTAVATVDANGVVTAVAKGTASIIATATADQTKKAAGVVTVDIPVVVPPVVTPATISIQQVTNNAGQNVPLTNVAGQINVALNVDAGQGNSISKVETLIDGAAACSQSFTQGSSAQVGVEATNAPVTIVCSINTAALTAAGVPVYANGSRAITARLVGSSGNTLASTSQVFVFNNTNMIAVTYAAAKTANDAAGLLWNGGKLTVTLTPSIFDAQVLQTVTLHISDYNNSLSTTKVITMNGNTPATVVLSPDTAAPDGIKNFEYSNTSLYVSGGVTKAGQEFVGSVGSVTLRLDNKAPSINTAPTFKINTVPGGTTNWLAKTNDFKTSCTVDSGISDHFNCQLGSQVEDEGVDLIKATLQFTNAPSSSSSTWTPVAAFGDLSNTAANAKVSRVQYCDNLGNCTNSANSIVFGIDLTPPVDVTVTDISGVKTAPQSITAAAFDSLSGFDLTNGYTQVQITKDSAKSDGSDVKSCVNAATGATAALPSSGTCAFVTVPGPAAPDGQTFTIPAGTNGYFTVVVQTADVAGNTSAQTTRFFLMDAVAPTVSDVSVSYTTGTLSAGVGGTIKDNVDLKQYTAYETFAAAIAGVQSIPFAAPTVVKAYGIPVNGKVTATATTPVILGVANAFGVAGVASTGFGFGGLDQAGNFGLGTVGLIPGTPGSVSGTDINTFVSGATNAALCNGAVADCDAAHNKTSTQDTVTIVMANSPTANPIVTMYFYRVVTYGLTSVAQYVGQVATPLPVVPSADPYMNLRVYNYKSPAIAAGDLATGDNSLFAIGVDKNGNGVLFGPVTVNVQTP